MGNGPNSTSRRSAVEKPEQVLSFIVNRGLGVAVDDETLVRFIKANWDVLSFLAHAIHDQESKP